MSRPVGEIQAKRSVEQIIASAGLGGQVVVEGVESRRRHFFVHVRATGNGARAVIVHSHGGHSRAGKKTTCSPKDASRLRRLINGETR